MSDLELLKLLKKMKKKKKEPKFKIKKLLIVPDEDMLIKKKKKLMQIYSSKEPSLAPVKSKGHKITSISKTISTPLTTQSVGLSSYTQKSSSHGVNPHHNASSGTSYFKSGNDFSNNDNAYSKNIGGGTSRSFTPSSQSNNKLNHFIAKSGQAKKEVNVIVKTNFVMAGRRQQDGSRATKEAVGSHASSALNYIENHGNQDLEQDEELSNVYDETGERVSKEDFKELRNSLEKDEEVSAMRRIVISPKEDLTREEMKDLTVKTLQEFQEQTNKDLSFKFAVHTDTENIHAHVVITGTNADINFSKEQLGMFKDISHQSTKEIEQERSLEVSISKQLVSETTLKKETEHEL